jgi:glycosyltransferase involved in cell wall biosynthesis
MAPPTFDDYRNYRDHRDREQPDAATPPLVSIITVALNAATTIERTIRSVQTQSVGGIEHVLVDGGSTDGTLDIIRRLARSRDFWISERDRGISDAFDKGLAMARGRYLLILNADDWLSPDQIERSLAALDRTGADFAFGDLIFYEDDRPFFMSVGDPGYARALHRRMPTVGHPTLLAARSCFERAGLFDLAYRNAMDYDWLVRIDRAGCIGAYSPDIVANMAHAGVSNRLYKRTLDEVRAIAVAHGRHPLIAATEARLRYVKTSLSHVVKRHARPLYHLVRRAINVSYRPAPGAGSVH